MNVHPLVVLICSNTGDGLTSWKGVNPILSVVLVCSKSWEGLTSWMGVHPFLSVVPICSKSGERLTFWMGVHPLSSVVLLWKKKKHWRGAHSLYGCSYILVNGSDLLSKHWRGTHCLDRHSSIIVSGSDLLKASNTGEVLTSWMGANVHTFMSGSDLLQN